MGLMSAPDERVQAQVPISRQDVKGAWVRAKTIHKAQDIGCSMNTQVEG
jgi:hypothetical protein